MFGACAALAGTASLDAIVPDVGVVIAITYWLVLAAWLVAALSSPARRAGPVLWKWVARRSSGGWWAWARLVMVDVRLWTHGHCRKRHEASQLLVDSGRELSVVRAMLSSAREGSADGRGVDEGGGGVRADGAAP